MNNIQEALFVLFFGIVAVFISLFFFYLLIFLLKKIDETINEYIVNKKLKSSDLYEKSNILTPELVAVISAAVYQAISKPIHIRKIKFLKDDTSDTWTAVGRQSIMGSHAIRVSRTKN